MSDTRDLTEQLVEEINERQEEISRCPHEQVVKDEDEEKWYCTECEVRFTCKSSSSFLPELQEAGDLSELVLKDYNPDWVRTVSLVRRLQQLEQEWLDNDDIDGYDIFGKFLSEIQNRRSGDNLVDQGKPVPSRPVGSEYVLVPRLEQVFDRLDEVSYFCGTEGEPFNEYMEAEDAETSHCPECGKAVEDIKEQGVVDSHLELVSRQSLKEEIL